MTKKERETRTKWLKKKMQENARSESLTMVQHTALMILCAYRHRLHVATEQFFALTEEAIRCRNFFQNQLPILLRTAGLPALGTDLSFSIPNKSRISRGNILEDMSAYYLCAAYISGLNSDIEDYLRTIDRECGTEYAPSGAQRIAREIA